MFPDPASLRPQRIREKLEEGLSALSDQVAIWFASSTIVRTLSTTEPKILIGYCGALHDKLILRTEENLELEEYILNNNIPTALKRLCVYLQRKNEGDIVEMIDFFQGIGPLIPLGAYLNVLVERCRQQITTGE